MDPMVASTSRSAEADIEPSYEQPFTLELPVPYDEMTSSEAQVFYDIKKDESGIMVFLHIRNRILRIWMENPNKELTYDDVLLKLKPPYNSDGPLVMRIHAYLDRHGLINFGIFEKARPDPSHSVGRIIIIGAGIAGLAAAQQLIRFGMEVVLLEARERVGGRIATFRKDGFIADLGASAVQIVPGNPLFVIAKQLNLELSEIGSKCPLYDQAGNIVAYEKQKIMKLKFKELIETLKDIAPVLERKQRSFSCGTILEHMLKLEERKVKEKQLEYHRNLIVKHENLLAIARRLADVSTPLHRHHDEYCRLDAIENRDITQEFEYRVAQRNIRKSFTTFDALEDQYNNLEAEINNLESNGPCEIFLSSKDRQILDWHFAYLEFASNACLDNLSPKHLVNLDDYELPDNNLAVDNGFSRIPVAMYNDLPANCLFTSRAVKQIRVTNSNVEVLAYNPQSLTDSDPVSSSQPSLYSYEADAVLCTLPLGVLKQSVEPNVDNPGDRDFVQFVPPLPDWKVKAIQQLGYGNVNKVVLCFDNIFWDEDNDLFGHLGSTTASRGEHFLFWSLKKSPVLIAFVVGNAADAVEEVTDDVVVGRCLTVLKEIFANIIVPLPVEVVVTRWKTDPWSKGSGSFIKKGSSVSDYHIMSVPVTFPPEATSATTRHDEVSSSQRRTVNRLFFAGEHTHSSYPSTVYGALLSGYREAARIANQFLGCPYSSPYLD